MRRMLLLGLTLAFLAGCSESSKRRPRDGDDNKDDKAQADKGQPPVQQGQAGAGNQGGNPGLGTKMPGGGVRTAVYRAVALNDLDNLRKLIQVDEIEYNRMPSKQEIEKSLQRSAPKIFEQIQQGAIVLTGTRLREGVWAYTFQPQSVAGEHLVVTGSSIGRMPAAELQQLLNQQQGQ